MRPIGLIVTLIKCFTKILAHRLSKSCEHSSLIEDSVFGFRAQRYTHDAILSLTSKIEDCRRCGLKAVAINIDLTKFYKSFSPGLLQKRMSYLGYCENDIQIVWTCTTPPHPPLPF